MPGFEKGQDFGENDPVWPIFFRWVETTSYFKVTSIWCLVGNMCGIHKANLSKKKKNTFQIDPNRTKQTICHTQRKQKRDDKRLSYPSWLVILGMWVKHPRLQQLRQVENLPPPPQERIFQETKWLGKAWLFFFHKGVASIFVGCHIHQGFR